MKWILTILIGCCVTLVAAQSNLQERFEKAVELGDFDLLASCLADNVSLTVLDKKEDCQRYTAADRIRTFLNQRQIESMKFLPPDFDNNPMLEAFFPDNEAYRLGIWVLEDNGVSMASEVIISKNDLGPNEKVVENDAAFVIVEKMPVLPACLEHDNPPACTQTRQFEHIFNAINYPAEARDNQIEGTVYVGFEISKEGKVENVNIVRGIHPLLDQEALRVINTFPEYLPGTQRGKPVRVLFTVPVKFVLR